MKRKTVVRKDAHQDQLCRIYVKGAPEEILPLCTQTLDLNVEPCELNQQSRMGILDIVKTQIAKKG